MFRDKALLDWAIRHALRRSDKTKKRLATTLLTAPACAALAASGDPAVIANAVWLASFAPNAAVKGRIATALLTDRVCATLAASGDPIAIGNAAGLASFAPNAAGIATALLTDQACATLAASGNPRAIKDAAWLALFAPNAEGIATALRTAPVPPRPCVSEDSHLPILRYGPRATTMAAPPAASPGVDSTLSSIDSTAAEEWYSQWETPRLSPGQQKALQGHRAVFKKRHGFDSLTGEAIPGHEPLTPRPLHAVPKQPHDDSGIATGHGSAPPAPLVLGRRVAFARDVQLFQP